MKMKMWQYVCQNEENSLVGYIVIYGKWFSAVHSRTAKKCNEIYSKYIGNLLETYWKHIGNNFQLSAAV